LGILVPEPASNAFRFVHRLMRDYLAYTYALKHLHDDDPAVRIEARRLSAAASICAPLSRSSKRWETPTAMCAAMLAALGQLEDKRAILPLIRVLQADTWNIVHQRRSCARQAGGQRGGSRPDQVSRQNVDRG
jgi:HEAT repeat protein